MVRIVPPCYHGFLLSQYYSLVVYSIFFTCDDFLNSKIALVKSHTSRRTHNRLIMLVMPVTLGDQPVCWGLSGLNQKASDKPGLARPLPLPRELESLGQVQEKTVTLYPFMCGYASLLSHVWLFVSPWAVAHQAPLSMGILQARILECCQALLQGIFPTQGSNPGLPHCREILYHMSHQGSLSSVWNIKPCKFSIFYLFKKNYIKSIVRWMDKEDVRYICVYIYTYTMEYVWMLLLSLFSQSVQSLSHVRFFVTPWAAVQQASLSITNSWSLLKLMSTDESVMPSNHLILCCPLLLPPSIFPSIKGFSKESALHIRWPKYWEFQLQHWSFQWIFRTDLL